MAASCRVSSQLAHRQDRAHLDVSAAQQDSGLAIQQRWISVATRRSTCPAVVVLISCYANGRLLTPVSLRIRTLAAFLDNDEDSQLTG